jgi:Flp pilus assembly protein TadB
VLGPLAFAVLMGWYQLASVVSVAGRRYRTFRDGVAAYVQLVAVCMTTRRSVNEAITYAADIGTGPAFDTLSRAVHAAPQMGIRVWEALELVGQEYDCRELEDLASSVAHVARIGVGVETTVAAVATRMRQVALDDMQRVADRQTASMVGPTVMFVAGVVLFLGYPLVIRIFDAFTLT